jgi:lysozyme
MVRDGEEFGSITRDEAFALMDQDLGRDVLPALEDVDVALNQHQADALASFIYNVGSGNFGRSTLRKRLNQGSYDAVPGELKRWTFAGGRQWPGLVRRREDEARLFTQGIYGGSK